MRLKNHIPLIFTAILLGICTFLPWLFRESVSRDVVENIYWGSQWQMGYYKHPPLFAWLNYGFIQLFGGIAEATYILNQLILLVSAYFVYHIARIMKIPKRDTFVLISLSVTCFYFNIKNIAFNANTLQTPLWAGLFYYWIRAIDTSRVKYFILIGIIAGLGLLTKYYFGLALVTIFCGSLVAKQFHVLRRSYISIAIAILVFMPHLVWLFRNDFLSLSYVFSKSHSGSNFSYIFYPLRFVLFNLFMVSPVLIGFFLSFRAKKFSLSRFQDVSSYHFLLAFFILFPFAFNVVASLFLGIRLGSMWGAPFWIYLPVLLYSGYAGSGKLPFKYVAYKRYYTLLTLFIAAFFSLSLFDKNSVASFPAKQVGKRLSQLAQPDYVSALNKEAMGALIQIDGNPPVIIENYLPYAPWVDLKNGSTVLMFYSKYKPMVLFESKFKEEEEPLLKSFYSQGYHDAYTFSTVNKGSFEHQDYVIYWTLLRFTS